jgi:hypothetical protein
MVLGPVGDGDHDDDDDETNDDHHTADDLILPIDADSDVIDETSIAAFGHVICSAIFVVGETLSTAVCIPWSCVQLNLHSRCFRSRNYIVLLIEMFYYLFNLSISASQEASSS